MPRTLPVLFNIVLSLSRAFWVSFKCHVFCVSGSCAYTGCSTGMRLLSRVSSPLVLRNVVAYMRLFFSDFHGNVGSCYRLSPAHTWDGRPSRSVHELFLCFCRPSCQPLVRFWLYYFQSFYLCLCSRSLNSHFIPSSTFFCLSDCVQPYMFALTGDF